MKFITVAGIIIRSDNSGDIELIVKIAAKLGAQIYNIGDELEEDLVLGTAMNLAKTGKAVSRETIMKKLHP